MTAGIGCSKRIFHFLLAFEQICTKTEALWHSLLPCEYWTNWCGMKCLYLAHLYWCPSQRKVSSQTHYRRKWLSKGPRHKKWLSKMKMQNYFLRKALIEIHELWKYFDRDEEARVTVPYFQPCFPLISCMTFSETTFPLEFHFSHQQLWANWTDELWIFRVPSLRICDNSIHVYTCVFSDLQFCKLKIKRTCL